MEILHKNVVVPENHTLSLTLPKNIPPGDAELILIIRSESSLLSSEETGLNNSTATLKDAAISKLADLIQTAEDSEPANSE
ncbi:hypothetical protein QUF61_15265 [Candidatus Venteria ishoeyi]|uniref:hypothetical protein n=1 Tax=Candidatus Venteria ishoeyi TaxID=1899563 RepID=UPI0025A61768|nr:hypothetical protein [Candidatus Venteria ishoeyi]MDM8547849.1 hypothetical protein [Candidatus Venteria ishoeyi]